MKKLFVLIVILMITGLFGEPERTVDSNEILKLLQEDIQILQKKAYDAYQKQDYENAIKYYLAYLEHNISDANTIYNLACSYGLNDNAKMAAKFLQSSYDAGFTDVEHIKNDPDFTSVRDSDIFQQTMQNIENHWQKKNKTDAETVYLESKTVQEGLISFPKDYDKTRQYKLMVGLHGYGSNAKNFHRLMNMCNRENFIFAVPYAPYAFSVGKDIGYSWNLWIENEEMGKRSALNSQDYILSFIKYMKDNYKISQVYLFGFSQGAFFSLDMALHHSDKFDGIIPFGGGFHELPAEKAVAGISKDLKIFIAHGNNDNVVEFDKSKKAAELLQAAGLNVKFEEFDGAHQVPVPLLQQAFDWVGEE